jgi:hypothetical protein
MNVLDICKRLLKEAQIASGILPLGDRTILAFEGTTVIGFVAFYSSVGDLIARWQADSSIIVDAHRLSLRLAQSKAWNTYMIFLTDALPSDPETASLIAIEEDLTGTRKIARAGIRSTDDVQSALLPLLPIQNAPRLEAIDMKAEIAIRTSGLSPSLMEAFLSNTPETVVAQRLEDTP